MWQYRYFFERYSQLNIFRPKLGFLVYWTVDVSFYSEIIYTSDVNLLDFKFVPDYSTSFRDFFSDYVDDSK